MSRRYDSRTTIFSPEGRLYQVEYAMEAISHAGTALGILSKEEGIVLIAEKKVTSKLLEQSLSHEKIYLISEQVFVIGIVENVPIMLFIHSLGMLFVVLLVSRLMPIFSFSMPEIMPLPTTAPIKSLNQWSSWFRKCVI